MRAGGPKPKYCAKCKISARRRARDKWACANPEKAAAAHARYQNAHKDYLDERRRAWGIENRERKRSLEKRWLQENRDRANAVERKRRERKRNEDPQAVALQRKKWRLRSMYGMSIGDYDLLLKAQDYACAICFDPAEKPFDFHVDHDHDTGKVRGLLCKRCNPMLGLARDSQGVLAGAIEYLNLNKGEYA